LTILKALATQKMERLVSKFGVTIHDLKIELK